MQRYMGNPRLDKVFVMELVKTIIIGAGPTGLSVDYHLNGNGIVLENLPVVGGLCRSFEMNDVVFDIGGHSFHTAHNTIRSFIPNELGVELFLQKRDARILFKGSVIPYPWQRFFHLIDDKKVVEDCIKGLEMRPQYSQPKNLHDFILVKYGTGIAQHFLFPYNRKLWRHNLGEISCDWASERIVSFRNKPSAEINASEQRTPLDENSLVGYPAKGGFNVIFKKMAARLSNIQFEQKVCFIDPHSNLLRTSRGDVFKWEKIVSTMPVTELVTMVRDVPNHIVQLANELPYVSLQVDFFVTSEPLVGVPQRLYCADADMPAHKIVFNSLSSENERNKPYHSIISETSIGDFGKSSCCDRTARIFKRLCDVGLIKDKMKILSHRYELVKYAYPVRGRQVKRIMDSLNAYLEHLGIYSIGRFGQWEYINIDQCFLKSKQLAERLISEQDIRVAIPS